MHHGVLAVSHGNSTVACMVQMWFLGYKNHPKPFQSATPCAGAALLFGLWHQGSSKWVQCCELTYPGKFWKFLKQICLWWQQSATGLKPDLFVSPAVRLPLPHTAPWVSKQGDRRWLTPTCGDSTASHVSRVSVPNRAQRFRDAAPQPSPSSSKQWECSSETESTSTLETPKQPPWDRLLIHMQPKLLHRLFIHKKPKLLHSFLIQELAGRGDSP